MVDGSWIVENSRKPENSRNHGFNQIEEVLAQSGNHACKHGPAGKEEKHAGHIINQLDIIDMGHISVQHKYPYYYGQQSNINRNAGYAYEGWYGGNREFHLCYQMAIGP